MKIQEGRIPGALVAPSSCREGFYSVAPGDRPRVKGWVLYVVGADFLRNSSLTTGVEVMGCLEVVSSLPQ